MPSFSLSSLRMIFLLSTIVTATDCCSSRILLLREHTLKIVHHHKLYDTERQIQLKHAHQQKAISLQRNNSSTSSHQIQNSTGDRIGQVFVEDLGDNENDEIPLGRESDTIILENNYLPSREYTASRDANSNTTTFQVDPSVRAVDASNPQYHVIDVYYTIMRDVLFFECGGQHFTDFCLNNGRCFRYPIGNHSFFSCECADGFVGERCESKNINELYINSTPFGTRSPRILMARLVFSLPMLFGTMLFFVVLSTVITFRNILVRNLKLYKKKVSRNLLNYEDFEIP